MKALNIETPEIVCKATDPIQDMIKYVQKLIENGYAYETSTAIYFDVSKLDYVIVHELSHFVHFNHSKDFWSLVEENCKEYKKINEDLILTINKYKDTVKYIWFTLNDDSNIKIYF